MDVDVFYKTSQKLLKKTLQDCFDEKKKCLLERRWARAERDARPIWGSGKHIKPKTLTHEERDELARSSVNRKLTPVEKELLRGQATSKTMTRKR